MKDEKDKIVKVNNTLATVDFGEFAGCGFENQTSNDMAIPFLGILQALSPQVTKGDPKKIPGAEPGMLINTVTNELLESPVTIVPCYTECLFVEWVPREAGGGFIGVHELDSEVVVSAKRNCEFGKFKHGDNDLVETFYMYCLLLDSPDAVTSVTPIVMAFTSTKIKVYKKLMTQLRTMKGNFPLFAFRLSIASVSEKNKKNQPYENFMIVPVNGSLMDSTNLPGTEFEGLLHEGKALTEAIRAGKAKVAHDSQSSGSSVGNQEEADEVF